MKTFRVKVSLRDEGFSARYVIVEANDEDEARRIAMDTYIKHLSVKVVELLPGEIQ